MRHTARPHRRRRRRARADTAPGLLHSRLLTPLRVRRIPCLCCILGHRLNNPYGTLTQAYSLVVPALTRLYRSIPYSVQATATLIDEEGLVQIEVEQFNG